MSHGAAQGLTATHTSDFLNLSELLIDTGKIEVTKCKETGKKDFQEEPTLKDFEE